MTDSTYTHILAIVDRSGSMFTSAADMIGGLNALFTEQAKIEGTCLVDYVQFDTKYEKVFEDRPVSQAEAVLEPRGGTALLDAIGMGVTELGAKLAGKHEDNRPSKVIVVVITDGEENSSREWKSDSVKDLIRMQEKDYGWDFTFLGANIDAVATGELFGFDPSKSITYSTLNTGVTTSILNDKITRTRAGGFAGYTDEERHNAQK